MAIIFYLVAKTNSAIILTAATLIGFLPQACLGPVSYTHLDVYKRQMDYYRKFDTVGLISLNDWHVLDFQLKAYDERCV